MVSVFLVLATVYLWSMPVTVVLEDDGFFILASFFNSVTHPPGYPLFVMLGHVFTWLPMGSVAFKIHLASACFGALACVCMWYLVRCLFEEHIYAWVGALGLGFSKTFWSQAIIAEVYTLNVLLFLVLFILALRCSEAKKGNYGNYCAWFAFMYGLSLSNHWPLIVLSTPALLVLLWPARQHLVKNILKYFPLFLLGLAPYFWLIWRSHAVPEYSFFGPIHSLSDFWLYVSRQLYAAVDYSLSAGWPDKLFFTGFALRESAGQLVLPALILVITGFLWQWITRPVKLPLAMTLAYLGNTIVLILIRDVDYDLFNQAAFQVYPLVSYLMLVLWAVYGIRAIAGALVKTAPGTGTGRVTGYALAVLVMAGTFVANVPHNYRKNDTFAADYARTVLFSLAPGAIFYANADNIDGPIRYIHAVEDVRPDVTVYTGRYVYQNNEFFRPYLLNAGELKKRFNKLIGGTVRPVYFTNDFPNDYASDRYGFYNRINRNRAPDAGDMTILIPAFLEKFRTWKEQYSFTNTWNIMHYNLLMADFCEMVLDAKYSHSMENNLSLQSYEDLVCNNYQGVLKELKFALHGKIMDNAGIEKLLKEASASRQEAFTKEEASRLEYYRGIYQMRLNNLPAAKSFLKKSMDIWPHPENPSRDINASIVINKNQ